MRVGVIHHALVFGSILIFVRGDHREVDPDLGARPLLFVVRFQVRKLGI